MEKQVPAVAALEMVTLRGRRGHRHRLSEVTLQIPSEPTAVMGLSGAGKTSLLNLLVGFESADAGTVERPGSVAWVPSGLGLWPGYRVRQHLETVGQANPDALLESFGLGDLAEEFPHRLSLGQQSRLAVARALATPSDVLVMDEPLAHVDACRRPDYWRVIREAVAQDGRALIFSTHEPGTVLSEASQVCCLINGRVAYFGDVETLYKSPESEALARFMGPVNWLGDEESRFWLGNHGAETPPSLRPESLDLEISQTSEFRCVDYRNHGAVCESTICHAPSGKRRVFWHRPHAAGKPGESARVCLQWLGLFLIALLLIACEKAPGLPALEVAQVKAWRLPIDGPKLPAPRSVAAGPDDEMVILDDAGRVIVFNREGEVQRRWRMPDVSVGRPEGVVVLDNGDIVVCDTHYHRVVIFDGEGALIKTFGESGRDAGEFIYPVAIAVDSEEHLYVGEYGSNDRIQKFTRAGEHVLTFGSFGMEPGQFQRPSGIVWHEGLVYVADAVNNRIQAFKDDGTFVKVIPLTHRGENVPLHLPYDLTMDREAHLILVEYGAGRILRCTREGVLLGAFGEQGSGTGRFHTPWGVEVDSRGHLRVADTGNRRLVALQVTPERR